MELLLRYLNPIAEQSQDAPLIERPGDDPVKLTGPKLLTNLLEEASGPEALKAGVLPWQRKL